MKTPIVISVSFVIRVSPGDRSGQMKSFGPRRIVSNGPSHNVPSRIGRMAGLLRYIAAPSGDRHSVGVDQRTPGQFLPPHHCAPRTGTRTLHASPRTLAAHATF